MPTILLKDIIKANCESASDTKKRPPLLGIDSNSKTVKGQKQGYMTAILYLAPSSISGQNVCSMAKLAGCIAGCLNTSGHGGMAKKGALIDTPDGLIPDNIVQRARILKTNFFHNDQIGFMAMLVIEIIKFITRAKKRGLIPVIRLNGTSDIRFENIPVPGFNNIFDMFPGIQFYDYTKIGNRKNIPANYYLCLSYSEANTKYTDYITRAAHNTGYNLVVVFEKELPKTFLGLPVVNGDKNDLRFLDHKGVIVGLKAKGKGKQDTSGFVIRQARIDADQLINRIAA